MLDCRFILCPVLFPQCAPLVQKYRSSGFLPQDVITYFTGLIEKAIEERSKSDAVSCVTTHYFVFIVELRNMASVNIVV